MNPYSPKQQVIDKDHWPIWSAKVASPAEPSEYNEAAVARLMKNIAPYVIDVKNVRPQFRPQNNVKLIPFQSKEAAEFYRATWERYQEECQRLQKESPSNALFLRLVLDLKFQMSAEIIKAEPLADSMMIIYSEGKAPVLFCKYKQTIAKVVMVLHEKYGISRDDISLIWGGDSLYSGTDNKEEFTEEQIREILIQATKDPSNIDIKAIKRVKEQLILQQHDLNEIPQHLRLGVQSRKQRQKEIDKFQAGKSNFALASVKAGGVGMSLHHSDDMTKEKVRRKPSGYAFIEDISKIPVRQREVIAGPIYSAIELVQFLGRVPRLTSLSPTTQTIVGYQGTIEEEVLVIVSQKLKCLRAVVRQNESWEDVLYDRATRDEKVNESRRLLEGRRVGEEDESTDLDTLGTDFGEED
jgi:hypothetical protein